jgi:transglutaminase-like putative cysteine protease
MRLTVAAGVAALLASMALYPLLWGWHWFAYGAGAVIAAAAVGAATRVRTLPVLACAAAAVAGQFLYLNLVFAGGQSWGGLVPTNASVHRLGHLVAQARTEMSHYAPPVPDARGILLMSTAGIGLVAVMADLLAVRLRRPAIAGLPLLVLFCVPLTTDAHSGWVGGTFAFSVGMAGYLALLSADGRERLRLWGRLVHRWHDEPEGRGPDTRPLTAAGRRIGLAAVVLAVFLPLLIPGLKQHRLFSGSGGGGGHGYHGQISLPNPLVELNKELHENHPQTVLTYRTPYSQPPYLQVYVLTRLDTDAWTLAPPKVTYELRKGNLPRVPGLAQGTPGNTVRESISLGADLTSSGTHLSYLPLPYAPRVVTVPGTSWRVDPATLTVLASGAQLGGLRYTATSDDVNPTAQQLRSAPPPPGWLGSYLAVPHQFQSLRGLAHNITAGRTTAYGKAVALQQWFTGAGHFTYSLNVPVVHDADALVQFLTHSRRGFCQQFAFAMAALARLLGIPSRVAVGYTQGTFYNGIWQVKTSDAHAWPELYFPGAGWLRFEPTPTGSPGHPGQGTAFAPSYSVPLSVGSETGDPQIGPVQNFGGPAPTASPGPGGPIAKLSHPQGGVGPGAKSPGTSPVPAVIVILALLAVIAIAPRASRSLGRRVRWWRATDDVQRAHAAWREVRDDLTDYRFACRASESPRALARRVAQALTFSPEQREALERIALAEERASYAATPAGSGSLARDVTAARRAIARSSGLPARCLAALLPLSALAPARASLQNALDVFGWIDVITARLPGRRRSPAVP